MIKAMALASSGISDFSFYLFTFIRWSAVLKQIDL